MTGKRYLPAFQPLSVFSVYPLPREKRMAIFGTCILLSNFPEHVFVRN
jgi:hypothetical protein